MSRPAQESYIKQPDRAVLIDPALRRSGIRQLRGLAPDARGSERQVLYADATAECCAVVRHA